VLLGIHLRLLIGPSIAVPAPASLTEALVSAEVTHSEEGHSGFQLTFQAGRSGPMDIVDYPLLQNPLLRTFNRVILMVTFDATPSVLFDGFITRQQLQPSNDPGGSTLTVSGEDVTVMMDLEKKKLPHPSQDERTIVEVTLAQYQPLFRRLAVVLPPDSIEFPPPTEHIPTQGVMTDREHVTMLGGRFHHVFYVTPGPVAGQNEPYWGPARHPTRILPPQPALSVNVGPASNVDSISFQYDALAPTVVRDDVLVSQDHHTIMAHVEVAGSTLVPPLALEQSPQANRPNVRVSTLGRAEPTENAPAPPVRAGMNTAQAYAEARSMVNAAADRVVTATGELDALRYGHILKPHGVVGLRGAGRTYDGLYYVKSVTHTIRKGDYKQRFTLSREGVGALTPIVRT
jgi:hypothetical protein